MAGQEPVEGRGRNRWSLAFFRAKPEQPVDQEARVQTQAFPGPSSQPLHCEHCLEWHATGTPRPSGHGDTLHRRTELLGSSEPFHGPLGLLHGAFHTWLLGDRDLRTSYTALDRCQRENIGNTRFQACHSVGACDPWQCLWGPRHFYRGRFG